MLTKEEAFEVSKCCKLWPGGMGCILVKDTAKKRGYRQLDWGFKGRVPANFDYSIIKPIQNNPNILLCPVTKIGLMNNAKNFTDHLEAYKRLIKTFMYMTHLKYESAKYAYNHMLKSDWYSLGKIFELYSEDKKLISVDLRLIISDMFVKRHIQKKNSEIITFSYVSVTGFDGSIQFIQTADGIIFNRNTGRSLFNTDWIEGFS